MARPRLRLAPPPKSENARRHYRVFSIRLTTEQRELLERAAAARYPHSSRPLGRFLRAALVDVAEHVLGVKRRSTAGG
ncbi:MAG TPA: hypothetical protein VGJ25_16260 [Gaiellaceae bacterium]|jgi:uncharacterized protein (DUF1778 family)